MELKVVRNKVKRELQKSKFEINASSGTATIEFFDEYLNEIEAQVLVEYSVEKIEHREHHSVNGMHYFETVNEYNVEIDSFVLEINSIEHTIDLSEFKETIEELIEDKYL